MDNDASLGIFFRDGIYDMLCAINEASAATAIAKADGAADTRQLKAYRDGYRAALVAIALAFGISPQSIWGGQK